MSQMVGERGEAAGSIESCSRQIVIGMTDGLHARPAAELVRIAKGFNARIEISAGSRRAPVLSSVKLMLLSLKHGDPVTVHAGGAPDHVAAAEAVAQFLASPERESAAPSAPEIAAQNAPAAPSSLPGAMVAGIPASEGQAIGPAFPFFPPPLPQGSQSALVPPAERPAEISRWKAAQETAIARLQPRAGGDARILGALLDIARDPEIEAAVEAAIATGLDALQATLETGARLAAAFEALEDPYMRARAEDMRGLTRKLAFVLLGREDVSLDDVPEGAIVVAEELHAWDLAKAPLDRIAGIVCRQGAATGHAAIIARSHNIPAILGCADLPVPATGVTIAMDGSAGAVYPAPDAALIDALRGRIAARAAAQDRLQVWRDVAPRTRAGKAISVEANLGSLSEIPAARAAGAMGVGLFRTELLMMEHNRLLTEDEQAEAYLALARAFAPLPVIVRTLDIGGDKPLPWLNIPREENPFLGWRGVRICLDREDVFRPQLRALLRAAVLDNLRVMVPMAACTTELDRVRALVDRCCAELQAEGIPHRRPPLGIMVETPAAVLLARDFAAHADFVSIGTNDLAQYVMAADRTNPRVSGLSRADHPAVLRAIAMVCEAAQERGIPVGICGEAASRAELIPSLIKLGVTELSMSPAAILAAKKTIAEI